METTIQSLVVKRRSPRVASFLGGGLGHIYCGHFVRGLAIYVANIAILAVTIMLVALMKGRFLQALLMGLVPAVALWLFARFDVRRLVAKASADYTLKEYNRWYVYVMLISIMIPVAVCGAFMIREVAYEAFVVVTDRMSPTIRQGRRVLVNKTIYDVEPMRRGDVVIVRSPGRLRRALVQRLVALPGDEVESRGYDILVNGVAIAHPPADASTQPATRPAGDSVKRTLPRGHGFFVSDNPGAELDGHDLGHVGEVPLANVVGRVEFIYWPRPTKVK